MGWVKGCGSAQWSGNRCVCGCTSRAHAGPPASPRPCGAGSSSDTSKRAQSAAKQHAASVRPSRRPPWRTLPAASRREATRSAAVPVAPDEMPTKMPCGRMGMGGARGWVGGWGGWSGRCPACLVCSSRQTLASACDGARCKQATHAHLPTPGRWFDRQTCKACGWRTFSLA